MPCSTDDVRVVPLPASVPVSQDVLTDVLRAGAQKLLSQAIEAEILDWIQQRAGHRDDQGRQQVVRNGYLPERTILSGLGPIAVEQPRVRDRRPAQEREKFSSRILPPYLRKTKSVEELIPWLYLKGISSGDFNEALAALLGPSVKGLSATTVTRLKSIWQEEYQHWRTRSLEGKRYVYVWADGVHFNIRLEDDRQCILVLLGATAEGTKEVIALSEGHRESEQSWLALLLDCQNRGLVLEPELAVADGALGFWKALPKVWPKTRDQRCWVHKTANVLDKLPKGQQPKAKQMIHDIWMAASRDEAGKAFDLFVKTWQAKYPKAAECLAKDRDALLTFYDFPAEHWLHIRTTNPIESVLATVRLRTCKTKGCGSRVACEAMVFKLMESAAKGWRKLNGSALLSDVIQGIRFVDGERSTEHAA
jgi:transposase-like protein